MRGALGALLVAVALVSCGPPPPSDLDADIHHGCPALREPLAMPGDPIDGDTWGSFAGAFFEAYCTRCHSSALVGSDARNGAPDGLNWDDPEVVRENLADIRDAVGVRNFMPPHPPTPACDERERLVRWIDAGAP